MSRPLVLVAMSGGVDSSLAAALLLHQGYRVVGATMRLWGLDQGSGCCSLEGAEDARRVCQVLGIPHYTLNFEALFRRYVVDYFVAEYLRGRTPNPCLACNRWLKFRFLLGKAQALGADYLATGHYARIQRQDGTCRLLKGIDPDKDQSYALYTLSQDEMHHLLLPLGDYRKAEVRRLAQEWGLPVAEKPDSQEICFAPDGDYVKLFEEGPGCLPGDILDSEGRVLGQHRGLAGYTVGQRRGLGVARGQRLYITHIDPARNALRVGPEADLLRKAILVSEVHFAGLRPTLPSTVAARCRYRSPEAEAWLEVEGDQARLTFQTPQRALAPGQAAVFYRGEEVLGGGIIEASLA